MLTYSLEKHLAFGHKLVLNRIQISSNSDLLKKRILTGEHMKRHKYSAVKNITAASSTISKAFTTTGNSCEPSSNEGKVCKTNVVVESSTTAKETNPTI